MLPFTWACAMVLSVVFILSSLANLDGLGRRRELAISGFVFGIIALAVMLIVDLSNMPVLFLRGMPRFLTYGPNLLTSATGLSLMILK